MAIVISGNGIDMGNNPVTNASQIDGVVINENNENVATTSNLVGFKNYIINGGFDVWQRGITFNGTSEYTADRWKAHIAGSVGTKNRSTNVPTGYKYALSLAMTGSASFTQIGQHIEFVNFKGLRGKTATLSFWVKANNTNISSMTYRIRYSTNLEDEAILFTGSTLVSGSKTVSTTWQKHTASFDVPTGTTSMSIEFVTGAVSNGDIFYITGVQLEEGSVATPFEQRPIGLELSLCQRYYWKTDNGGMVLNQTDVETNASVTIKFPVTMRVIPTEVRGNGQSAGITKDFSWGYVTCPHKGWGYVNSYSVNAEL